MFIAHTDGKNPPHDLWSHLKDTALLAERFGAKFGDAAALLVKAAGMLHDLGKASKSFQKKIGGENNNATHSNSGAILSQQRAAIWGTILSQLIAAHHSGLRHDILERLKGESAQKEFLETMRESIPEEIFGVLDQLNKIPVSQIPGADKPCGLALWFRMLFSVVVDADFTDTSRYYKNGEIIENPTLSQANLDRKFFDWLESNILNKPKKSNIDILRTCALNECLSHGIDRKGLFRLTLPTGMGKTISSMAWAVKHAIHHDLDRIIYVAPYMTIIDQTAQVFREIFGSGVVLEHHSTADLDDEWAKAASENWDAPIIVTTSVQFFESLFANRPSKLRKLHRIAKSVVIIDEVQNVPTHLLKPILATLEVLAEHYNTSILLMTATQPAYEKLGIDKKKIIDLVSKPEYYWQAPELNRVKINQPIKMRLEEVANRLQDYDRVLCIAATRKDALDLFRLLGQDAHLLSATMCPMHRRQKLGSILNLLKQHGTRVRIVSTSLVEAGINIDLPVVWRAMTGLDSILQAAGRCNREGLIPLGEVFLFETEGTAKYRADEHRRISATRSALDLDKTWLKRIEHYFSRIYHDGVLDKHNIIEKSYPKENLSMPFEEIAKLVRIIDDDYCSVVVPYNDDAAMLIKCLLYRGMLDIRQMRRLQSYIVQVPQWAITALDAFRPVSASLQLYVLTDPFLYQPDTGLDYWGLQDILVF